MCSTTQREALLLFTAILVTAFSHAQPLPLQCTTGIMATPRFGTTNAVFTVCSNLTIPATPSLIYNVLADFPRYHEWNSFVYDIDLPTGVETVDDIFVEMPMTFYTRGLVPGLNTTSEERMTALEGGEEVVPKYIAWRYDGGPAGDLLMQAEHVSLLVEVEGGTRYVSWETYYGPGAPAVLALEGQLNEQFAVQGYDLRNRVACLG